MAEDISHKAEKLLSEAKFGEGWRLVCASSCAKPNARLRLPISERQSWPKKKTSYVLPPQPHGMHRTRTRTSADVGHCAMHTIALIQYARKTERCRVHVSRTVTATSYLSCM